MYKHLIRPILFKIDPEKVHDFFIIFGDWLGKYSITRNIVSWSVGVGGRTYMSEGYPPRATLEHTRPHLQIDGIKYSSPFLLGAGFDYNGRLTNILPCIGLGGEEIGSVTARPCLGNPKPRLKRLINSRSIIVNKGLKNDGVDKIIQRLEVAPPCPRATLRGLPSHKPSNNFIIGISIARTNDNKSVTIESGIEDYAYTFKRLSEEYIGDYYTINISCPNAFGGESFATNPESLDILLKRLISIPHPRSKTDSSPKPVYIKMPINIAWDKFQQLLEIIDRNGLQGVVIGNLNKNYDYIDARDQRPQEYIGGLSGAPCSKLSNELIRKTRERYGKRFTIIGVGGVMSAEDAKEKFEAGADLIHLITGLIYEGPSLISKLNRAIFLY